MAYWRDFPPPHILIRTIAVGIGVYTPDKPSADEGMSDAQLRAMF